MLAKVQKLQKAEETSLAVEVKPEHVTLEAKALQDEERGEALRKAAAAGRTEDILEMLANFGNFMVDTANLEGITPLMKGSVIHEPSCQCV